MGVYCLARYKAIAIGSRVQFETIDQPGDVCLSGLGGRERGKCDEIGPLIGVGA